MPTVETEFKNFKIEMRKEMALLRKIIVTKMVPDKWIKQDLACIILNVKPRQLRNIRRHLDSNQKSVGSISWKKGKGKNILYYLPDIEKYNGDHVIMN